MCLPVLGLQAAEWQYRVRPGDTLWDLAAKHMKPSVPWQRLQAHNHVADPYTLPPGTRLRFPVQWLAVHPKSARVVAFHGPVTVRRKPDAAAKPATEDMRLGIGALLETGDDASATIEFADRSRTLVLSNSRVTFDRLSAFGATGMVDTQMRLQRGRTSNQVTPARGPASRFIIGTPSATTSVRGTHFRVATLEASNQSSTEVLEGRVAVKAGASQVDLSEGYGVSTEADADAPPTRQSLLDAPRLQDPPSEAHAATPIAWASVSGADRYRVLVAEAGQPDVLAHETTTQATTTQLPALAAGSYVVTVRGIASSGLEGRDAVHPITAPGGPPAPIALRVADENGRVSRQRPRFAWANVEQARDYRLQVAADASFTQPVVDTVVSGKELYRPKTLPPGDYHWRVAALDGNGDTGRYSSPEAFTVVEQAPFAPLLDRKQRVVRWEEVETDSRYRVQLSRQADFSKLAIDRVVDEPRLELAGLRSGRWYVRVQEVLDGDDEAASFQPPQLIDLPCRWCKVGAAAALLLLAL